MKPQLHVLHAPIFFICMLLKVFVFALCSSTKPFPFFHFAWLYFSLIFFQIKSWLVPTHQSIFPIHTTATNGEGQKPSKIFFETKSHPTAIFLSQKELFFFPLHHLQALETYFWHHLVCVMMSSVKPTISHVGNKPNVQTWHMEQQVSLSLSLALLFDRIISLIANRYVNNIGEPRLILLACFKKTPPKWFSNASKSYYETLGIKCNLYMNCLCTSVGHIFLKRIKTAENNFPVRISLDFLKWEAKTQRERCGLP